MLIDIEYDGVSHQNKSFDELQKAGVPDQIIVAASAKILEKKPEPKKEYFEVLLTVSHDDKSYVSMTIDELKDHNIPDDVISGAIISHKKTLKKQEIRGHIFQASGDVESMLGTTADAAALALYLSCQNFVISYETGSADYKTAVENLNAGKALSLASNFIERIENGTVVLPVFAKGLDAAVADIEQRSNAVSSVLQKAAEGVA